MTTPPSDNLGTATDARLACDLCDALGVIPALALVRDASLLWPHLSQYHWTAFENEPGDYTVMIRSRRGFFRGAIIWSPIVGRGPTFARAAAIALLRFHRAQRGTS